MRGVSVVSTVLAGSCFLAACNKDERAPSASGLPQGQASATVTSSATGAGGSGGAGGHDGGAAAGGAGAGGEGGSYQAGTCADPVVLSDPAAVVGSTLGAGAVHTSTCFDAETGAPEDVFVYTPTTTGRMTATLTADANLSLSVRSTCDDAQSELSCVDEWPSASSEKLVMNVTAGEALYLVVDGETAADEGSFVLEVESVVPMCGDGVQDADEECDDENPSDDDGCDAGCDVEASFTGDDATHATAPDWASPWFGQIAPSGDVDVVAITTTAAHSTVIAQTTSLTSHSCEDYAVDSFLELRAADGTTVLGDDDDLGAGFCAKLVVSALPPGTYYLYVSASPDADDPDHTFPYKLPVDVEPCGNGFVKEGEQCDDGNTLDGDGCSATCQFE